MRELEGLQAFKVVREARSDLFAPLTIHTGTMAFYAPKLYRAYDDTLGQLFDSNEHLRHNFANSVLPASAFNLGPATECIEHVDGGNISYGLCPITSAGLFDPTRGGHLVVKQPKLVIEFPPGSTILIPSGTLTHSNTSIQPGETRYSMTQYCAGGLFRWVNYGFRTAKSLLAEPGGKEIIEKINGPGDTRWMEGLSLYSTIDSLSADRASI
jgi:hypothetical protein